MGLKIENLFMNVSVVSHVRILKVRITHYTEHVEIVSPGEVQIEVGLVEVEDSVIVRCINAVYGIIHPKGAVTEGGEERFLGGPERQYRDLRLIR